MIVLRDGLTYEGSPEALFGVLHPNFTSHNAFTHHYSQSKELISLVSMNKFHLMKVLKVTVERHLQEANGINSITGIRHWTQKFVNAENHQSKFPQFFGFLNAVDNHIASRPALEMSMQLNGLTIEGNAIDVFSMFTKVTNYPTNGVNEFAEFDGVLFTNKRMLPRGFVRYINILNVTINTIFNDLESFQDFLSQLYDYEVVAGTYPELGGLLHELKRRVELLKISRNLPRYYFSSSKGRILISDMALPHLMTGS